MSGESTTTDVPQRIERRLQARMSETDAVLWTAVLVASAADVVTTLSGLALGLGEGNVVVRTAIETLGLPGFWIVKFLALCGLVASWYALPARVATAVLGAFAVVTLAVVAHNALTLAAL